MPNVITLPAPADRPDFATWFGQIHKMNIDMSRHVYGRRLNVLYVLRSMGIPAKLETIPCSRCGKIIIDKVVLT